MGHNDRGKKEQLERGVNIWNRELRLRAIDRSYVEANRALLRSPVAGVLGRVEARREVAAADEAMQAAGVKVGQLPDEAARPREPLLHRRQPPPDLHARDDDVAHACATLAKAAVAQGPWCGL